MPPRPARPRRHLRDPRLEAGPPAGQAAGAGHARRPLETDGRVWLGAPPAQPEPPGVVAQAEVFSASAVNNPVLGEVAPDRSDRLPVRNKDARSFSGLIASLLVHSCLLATGAAWVAAPSELERGGEAFIPVEFVLVGPVEQARQEANGEQAARVTTPEREPTPEKPPATLPPLDSDEVPASPDASAVRATEPAPIEPVLQTQTFVDDAMQPQAQAQEPAAEPLPPLGKAAPPGAPAAERALEPEAITPAPATPPSPELPAAPAEAFATRNNEDLPTATNPSASPPASAPSPPKGATVNTTPRATPAKPAVAARRAPERASRPDRAAAAPPEGRTRPAQPALQRGGRGGAAATDGVAEVASWRARVLAHLARHKTYPDWARDQGVEGRASVAFTLDRSGQVTSVSLAGSSGSTILDQATLAMVRRATPFPPMPDGGPVSMSFTAAIRYDLR